MVLIFSMDFAMWIYWILHPMLNDDPVFGDLDSSERLIVREVVE